METTAANLPHRRRRTEDLVRALALTTQFGDRLVLDGIDLAIRRGEVFVIMGPSGCGKTTLLRNLCGLLPPTLGSVSVAGHDLYAASPALLQHLRLRTGLSFQGDVVEHAAAGGHRPARWPEGPGADDVGWAAARARGCAWPGAAAEAGARQP
ncbi:MAG: ATP-binding cassette domain-containing protein, partial [Planctomycetes bacterium]|nr:ATP-binding cassette domain-containing protein [Planctomycetota bacterium]